MFRNKGIRLFATYNQRRAPNAKWCIFTILEKNLTHHSTKYHEALPFMQRLTWDGGSIHAGYVLSGTDSHGCIHVPMKFAKNLYDVTKEGATVLITAEGAPPQSSANPGLEFSKGKPSPVPKPSPQDTRFLASRGIPQRGRFAWSTLTEIMWKLVFLTWALEPPRQPSRTAFTQRHQCGFFRDNGIGMSEHSLERIFKIFQRVGRAGEGTVIGLAIVRKAVEEMDGTVGVDSELGKGSAFWLDLQVV